MGSGSDKSWNSRNFSELGTRVAKTVQSWSKRVPEEKHEALELASQLIEQPQPRRLILIRNSSRFSTWPLVDRLCEESRSAATRDAKAAIDLAEIAVEIAEGIEPAKYGSAIRADIGARAWAYLGNALRVGDQLTESGQAFDRAITLLETGTLLDNSRAEILYLRAHLESNLSNFTEARALVAEAQQIYSALGDTHLQGRMFLIAASIDRLEGSSDSAVAHLRMAAQLTDVDREPRVVLVAQQNLVLALADLERFEEAEAQLPATWEILRSIGTKLDKLRMRWTEARIDEGLGRLYRAEITLTEVKEAFKSLDMPYDAALASLELALIYSQQGRTREMKLLALEMLPVFARNENHRDAMAAMTLFAKAAAVEEATREIVEKTLGSLREAASRQ